MYIFLPISGADARRAPPFRQAAPPPHPQEAHPQLGPTDGGGARPPRGKAGRQAQEGRNQPLLHGGLQVRRLPAQNQNFFTIDLFFSVPR